MSSGSRGIEGMSQTDFKVDEVDWGQGCCQTDNLRS